MNDLKKLLQRRRSKFYNFNSSEERKKEGKKVKKEFVCVWVCSRWVLGMSENGEIEALLSIIFKECGKLREFLCIGIKIKKFSISLNYMKNNVFWFPKLIWISILNLTMEFRKFRYNIMADTRNGLDHVNYIRVFSFLCFNWNEIDTWICVELLVELTYLCSVTVY